MSTTVDEVKAFARQVIERQPRHAFGHGYLWGYVNARKILIAAIDGRLNHDEIQRQVESHEAVSSTYINLD